MPREHGTWFMVLGPLCIGLAGGPAPDALQAVLLTVAVLAAFFAQDEGRTLLRRKRTASARRFAAWCALSVAVAIPLLVRHPSLGFIAGTAAILAVPQIEIMRRSGRRRFDRTRTGQLLGVMLMTLTAPTGFVVAHGELTVAAWWLWLACVGYFGSGVFVVHMLFSAARKRCEIDRRIRWELGRGHLAYHALLAVVVTAAAIVVGGTPGVLLATAYLPALARAVVLWVRLSSTLPKLVRVGILEGLYAAWFTGFVIAACQVVG